MIEDARVRYIIDPSSANETINAIFFPDAPREAIKLFSFMEAHISLVSNGMGVGLRENRADIKQLLESEGFDYAICQNFIATYENKLISQYYEAQEDK